MGEDHKRIEVVLAGRSYPLKIKPSEEQHIRAIVSRAEQCFVDMKSKFPLKDGQDYLAMTLLTLGNEYFQLPDDPRKSDMEDSLRKIEGYLDDMLE